MKIAEIEITWQEAAKRWRNGDPVFSISLGGIGPSYEQCIQILVFEFMAHYPKELFNFDNRFGKERPTNFHRASFQEWDDYCNPIVDKLDKVFKFSGAQVGAAKMLAFKFMQFGYKEMLESVDFNNLIQVSKNFPRWEKEK